MRTRLSPWQRIVVAMASGITLAPSRQMKWMANVTLLGAQAHEGTHYAIFPIYADYEMDAAQQAAIQIGKEIIGPDATGGFVNPQGDTVYFATVGVYQGFGLTKSRTLKVKIDPYEGQQT